MEKLIWLILVLLLIIGPGSSWVKIMTNKIFLILFSFFIISSFLALPVSATTLGLETNNLPNGATLATLIVDTENEKINALSGYVIFDGGTLDCQIGSDAKSIINLWIERPAVNVGDQSFYQQNSIFVSGIIPGGFVGQGQIISLVCRKKNKLSDVSGFLKIDSGFKILTNDASSTPVTIKILPTKTAGAGLGQDYLAQIKTDKTAPEIQALEIIKDENLSGGKSLLVFKTADKESGIDYSAVLETDKNFDTKKDVGQLNSLTGWITTGSPYELTDEARTKYIYLKVADRAGNVSVASLSPVSSPYKMILILVIIMLAIIFLANKLWHGKNKQK